MGKHNLFKLTSYLLLNLVEHETENFLNFVLNGRKIYLFSMDKKFPKFNLWSISSLASCFWLIIVYLVTLNIFGCKKIIWVKFILWKKQLAYQRSFFWHFQSFNYKTDVFVFEHVTNVELLHYCCLAWCHILCERFYAMAYICRGI